MKRIPETVCLKEADSQALQQSLKDLERAYKNFFEKRAGYPLCWLLTHPPRFER